MSAPNQASIDETEKIEVANEAISNSDVSTSQVISRKVMSTSSVLNPSQLTPSQTSTSTSGSGRQVLPVVYFNVLRNRVANSGSPTAVTVVNQSNPTGGILLNNVAQVLPPGALGSAFLPGVTQKITVNPTANTTATAGSASQQPHYVTIRSASQSGNTNTSVTSQPHYVTIPKESLPDGILKSGQSHQQFVTMVPKSTLTSSSGQGQIVTIRAPFLSGGGASSGGAQNQILTIQTPVLQQGTNQATLVPISAANSSGKPHISYMSTVLKNGTPPNLVSSTPKMVLSTVPTLQKSSHTFSSAPSSPTVTQSPSVVPVSSVPVTNIVKVPRSGSSGSPTITIVPSKEQTPNSTVTIVPPKDVTVHPGRETTNQTVTILSKDSVAGKPTITVLSQKDPAASQPIVLSSKDTASRINPVPLLSSMDINTAGSTVTLVSTKDLPQKSPITLIPKDSPCFTIRSSKEAGNSVKLVSSKDAAGKTRTVLSSKETPAKPTVAVLSSNDPIATNPTFRIVNQESTDSNSVRVDPVKDTPSPCVTVLQSVDSPSGIPTFSFVPSKDANPGNPTLTLLSSNESTPSTVLPPKEDGLPTVMQIPSKDSIPNSTFTILSSQEKGNPTVTIVRSKEIAEAVSSNIESAPKPPRLTTLPFSLSSEMTVTTSEVPRISHPQFQQIGKDISTSVTAPVEGFIPIDTIIESQRSIDCVNLPDSTTLRPISEAELVASKTHLSFTEESIIVKKELVEVRADSEPKAAKRNSLLISNNPKNEASAADKLSKSLQDAVNALCASKDVLPAESLQQTAVISCRDEDEVTLIKLTPTSEESKDKFATLDDNPDDIKIELIKCTEVLESSKSSDTDVDDVSINIEKDKSRSPSPMPPLVSALKSTKSHNFLPSPKSLSNIRSPSILKSHIANKGRKLGPNLLNPVQYRPHKGEIVKRAEFSQKSGTSFVKTEPKNEIKKEPDSTATPDDFDPIKALEWKNGVGLLPGSNLKFRVNEFGFIEMISDDDKEQDGPKSSQQSSQNSDDVDGSAESGDEKDVKPDKKKLDAYYEDEDDENKEYDPEDIIRCKHCGVYGMAGDFVNQRYCNISCQEGAALKKAAEFKREQEHRALKLRRKRRRLERISERPERGSLGVKKEDNVDDPMEVDDVRQSVSKDSSLNPTPIPSDDDAMSVTSNEGVETAKSKSTKAKQATQFTWVKYLESTKAKGAPAKLFKDDGTYTKNKFKVGMKMEGIDPEHPAHFCVLSVAEIKGCRLRLHFDGYSESHDFWVNIDSPEIFPVGWCQKNNRRLDPPRGFTASTFNWNSYLKTCRAFAAPRHFFAKGTSNAVCPNGFRVGMKLEAVDRKDSSLICVASVADILDNRILVHFDSWDDMYDYWVDPSSPYIHPVGWCAENERILTPPNEFKDPSSFSWSAYLKQTKSIPAPARAFKQRPPVGFKRGMRLEAVDKRAPQYIRVAAVEEAVDHRILLHFDGWPRIYDYWVDEDCPDIHRPGWCRDTKHPLEAPLTKEELRDTTHCVTPGCRGEGHIKGAKFSSHATVQNCPYSPENMEKEGLIPDRLNPKGDLEYSEIPTPEKGTTLNNAMRLVEGRRPLGRPRKWKRHLEVYHQNKKRRVSEDNDGEKRSVSPLETASKLQLELHQSVFEPGYRVDVGLNRSACWAKHSLPLHTSPMLTEERDPHAWSPNDVSKFVSTVTGLEEKAEKFCEEEIDGEALLLMTQQDLVDNIGLKLGPAIKLYNCIVLLRQRAS